MSLLFLEESGTTVRIDSNRVIVSYKDGLSRSLPIESVDGITIFGNINLTTPCIQTFLRSGIPVSFCSKGGKYFGRLHSTGHMNAPRQRQQCKLYESDFAIQLGKRIISAKLKNQRVILRRYSRNGDSDISESMKLITSCISKIPAADTIEEIMGYEGQGAKVYFRALAELIEPEFRFKGRSKRPPMDEFNSMISLGYSLLMNELYAAIEMKGLNPYFGFIHRDKERHPTLASDLMEEWRATIVDSVAMSLVNGHEIQKDHFIFDFEDPGCYLTKDGMRIFLNKLERRMQNKMNYLSYTDFAISFRQAINMQVDSLVRAIEQEDAELYKPVEIR